MNFNPDTFSYKGKLVEHTGKTHNFNIVKVYNIAWKSTLTDHI